MRAPSLSISGLTEKTLSNALVFHNGLSTTTFQGLFWPCTNDQPQGGPSGSYCIIVVYHLVYASIDNSGQTLLCTQGFLHVE